MKKKSRFWVWGIAAVGALGLWHGTMVEAGAAGSGDGWLRGCYFALLLFSLGSGVFAAFLLWGTGRRRGPGLERIYPAAGLCLGLLYMAVLPPFSAPDEVSHYISAYQLSSRLLGRPANSPDGHVLVRTWDWMAEDVYGEYPVDETEPALTVQSDPGGDARYGTLLGQELTEDTYRVIREMALGGAEPLWEEGLRERAGIRGREQLPEQAVSVYPPVTTTPLAYVPQALGIALARLLDLDTLWLLYLGRLFNLLFFVGMTGLAMKLLPFGKEVLFGTALLPMTLHLASSFSYDVMILACMFLFTAQCLRLAYRAERVAAADVLLLAVLMAVAGPCKMVYGILMGLCLLIPVRKFGGWGKWLLSAAAVAGAWLAAMFLVNAQVVMSYATAAEGAVSGSGEPGFSLAVLLHRPGLLLQMFYNTLVHQTEEYALTMIGSRLGNLDPVLNVPDPLTAAFAFGLLLLALRGPGETVPITGRFRVWVFLVCAACGAALMLSMLIACTPRSSTVIEGVQGRYFLPFLPVFLMACKNDWLVLTKDKNRSILYVMYCMDLYAALRLFSVVSTRL